MANVKVYNVVTCAAYTKIEKGKITTEYDISAFLCDATDKKDAEDFAMRRLSTYEPEYHKYTDLKVFVTELSIEKFRDILSPEDRGFIRLENVEDADFFDKVGSEAFF